MGAFAIPSNDISDRSSSNSPSPRSQGSTAESGSISSLGCRQLPEGTVASQVMRTQRQQDYFSTPRPYAEMLRDGEQSGWGRRVEGTVRLVKPASRFNVIEPEHKLLKPIDSSHIRNEPPQRKEAEPAGSSPAARGANALLHGRARGSISRHSGSDHTGLGSSEEVVPSPMPPANKTLTSSSTPSELRQEARQMFERYGLSPPIS